MKGTATMSTLFSQITADEGATAIITHSVCGDKHPEYESWLDEIAPMCRAAPGYLDWHIVRPISGVTKTYTVIIRFATILYLQQWMESVTRAQLIEKVRPLLVAGDDFSIISGLDFWFMPRETKAKIPIRWKQYLVTWSAIYPLVLGVPLVVLPILRVLGVAQYHYTDMLIITAIVVALMVYIVMPRYTRLIRNWLFK